MNDTYIFMDKDAFRFKEMLCERDRGKFEWLIQDYNDVHNENIRLLCEIIQLKNQLISKMTPDNSCVVSDDYKAGHRAGYEEALRDMSKHIDNNLGMLSITDHVTQKMGEKND